MSCNPAQRLLTCVECGREQVASERGWRAYLTTDEDQPAEAIVYCSECAAREFGPLT
jgi:PhoPQ-activated pathogenicity-related protein